MTLPKFEWIEEYLGSSAEYQKRVTEVAHERDSALEKVQALKADYAQELRRGVMERVDVSGRLAELDAKIEEAERMFKYKDEALRVAQSGTVYNPVINKGGLTPAWLAYKAKYIEEVVNPRKQAMLDAKLAYIDAVQAHRAAVRHYEAEKSYALNTVYPNTWPAPGQYSLGVVDFELQAERDKYQISREDIYLLTEGRPVQSIQHVKRGTANE